MKRFVGHGGKVFAVGDAHAFTHVPLWDTGDGWDYVAPDGLSCWVGSTMVFEVQNDDDDDGGWEVVEPVEMYERTGRVGFGRCFRGRWVRASGVCYPTAFVGWGAEWRLDILASVPAAPVIGSDRLATKVRVSGVVAAVDGVMSPPLERAFAVLPFANGAYSGFGELCRTAAGVKILFDDEGVVYEPCC